MSVKSYIGTLHGVYRHFKKANGNRQTNIQMDKTDGRTEIRQTNRQTDEWTDRWTGRHTDRQMNGQTDGQRW